MNGNHWISIPAQDVIYRVRHRIMEGGCQVEHGPLIMHCPAFEMQKYPVTNEDYVMFIEETGYHAEGNFLNHLKNAASFRAAIRGREKQPVVYVSMDDARAYAEYMGAALPTELMWYVAAGGASGLNWPWGDRFDPARTNDENGVLCNVDAHPLGASPYGIMDMVGNCWEWVGSEVDDGQHLFAILRGGSCYRAPHFWHMQGGPHPIESHMKMPLLGGNLNRSAMVGFRLAREVQTK